MVKNLPADAGDTRRRFYLCVRKISSRRAWQPAPVFLLENGMERGAWRATVHKVTESDET